ncbi:MAG: TonB family protein [Candidatus Acidiferrum sp.]
MRDLFLRSCSGNDSSSQSHAADSWLNRVRENLGQLLIPSHLKPSSVNGAPIHLLKFDKSLLPARAQGASLLTHAAVFAALVFLLTNGPGTLSRKPFKDSPTVDRLTFPAPLFRTLTNANPNGGKGSGGAENPIPTTNGNPPPHSLLLIVKPTIPQNQNHVLPEPPTIFDPNAAPVLTPNEKIGLPWMPKDTNSGGPGKGKTMGLTGGPDVGDGGDGPMGDGTTNGQFRPGFIPPGCAYCPYPTYTDDARHGKVQGSVTLQVLVDADGRAQDIRIVKGIGFGLDERAIETVRGWKFTPARDGSKRAVPAWVTIEAVFRLF